MRAFAAIDLVADLALGIGDEQPALRPLHEDDEADQRHGEGREDDEQQRIDRAGARLIPGSGR